MGGNHLNTNFRSPWNYQLQTAIEQPIKSLGTDPHIKPSLWCAVYIPEHLSPTQHHFRTDRFIAMAASPLLSTRVLGLLLVLLCVALASSSSPPDNEPARRLIVQFESEPLARRFGPALQELQAARRKRASDQEDVVTHDHRRFERLVERKAEAREHVARMESERSAFLGSLDDLLRSLAHKRHSGSNTATPVAGPISITSFLFLFLFLFLIFPLVKFHFSQ
jgi:hypothetical protein